jgi:hypothetical protein
MLLKPVALWHRFALHIRSVGAELSGAPGMAETRNGP